MLLSILSNFSKDPRMAIISILLIIPSLLIALTVHEYCHGRMALALGDKTALQYGRLSLNPIHHIDPIGALMLLLFGFGFAKPVPVNMRNVTRVNYKLGTILISLAGPFSNFVLALLGVFGYMLTFTIALNTGNFSDLIIICIQFFQYFAYMNIGLGIFNLIPIPPLDGSRVLTIFLPAKAQIWFHKYEQIIQLIIFVLLFSNVLDGLLYTSREWIFTAFCKLISMLPFIISI